MNQPTILELKQLLAKMLTGDIEYHGYESQVSHPCLFYSISSEFARSGEVKGTELLSLCWEVEKSLSLDDQERYTLELGDILAKDWNDRPIKWPNLCYDDLNRTKLFMFANASWEQRTLALARVKRLLVRSPRETSR